jgi:hypothetical protein
MWDLQESTPPAVSAEGIFVKGFSVPDSYS